MGLYDRDYYREEQQPGVHVSFASWTWTTRIIVINVAVYLVQLMTKPEIGAPLTTSQFHDLFVLHADWWNPPWRVFELLTYGFMHSVNDLWHILGNMVVLWFLGRPLEQKYGSKEFLSFYLVAIVIAGLGWSIAESMAGSSRNTCVGASGGVTAVLILFALNYPRQELLLWFVIPVPAWAVAALVVVVDIMRSFGVNVDNVGYQAHLAGAFFAFIYFKMGLRISGFLPGGLSLPSLRRRPKLRVHRPDTSQQDEMEQQLDAILKKIKEHGQDSLSAKEKKILQKASREYQQRRH